MLQEHFQKVEDEYFRLKGRLGAGRLTKEQFVAALDRLMFVHEGRYWMIGADSGKWYVHDGRDWVEAAPPGLPPLDGLDTAGVGGRTGGTAGVGDFPQAEAPRIQTEEAGGGSDVLLDPELQAVLRERAHAVEERGVVCSRCGEPIKPEDAFCTDCGTPVSPPAVASSLRNPYCTQCGASIRPEIDFCTSCGTRVG